MFTTKEGLTRDSSALIVARSVDPDVRRRVSSASVSRASGGAAQRSETNQHKTTDELHGPRTPLLFESNHHTLTLYNHGSKKIPNKHTHRRSRRRSQRSTRNALSLWLFISLHNSTITTTNILTI